MVGLALLVCSIGLVDSLNPSTVVPALWLAGSSRARVLAAFALGAFVVYLGGGLVLVLGPGPAVISALRGVRGPVEHIVLLIAGVAVLAFGVTVWRSRGETSESSRVRRSYGAPGAFALGAGIMAVELPTAFVYFGAVSAVLAAKASPLFAVALLVAYNTLFVAPLLVILGARCVAGGAVERWLTLGEARIRKVAQVALAGLASCGGTALVVVGILGI
jgi:hypothetical protein